jgi:hypothetical protein
LRPLFLSTADALQSDMPSSVIDNERLDKYCQEKQILRW